jgi:hypothetical protein
LKPNALPLQTATQEGDFTYLPLFFYPKLFELDPTTKPLFKDTTVENQGKKLMLMLNIAVDGVEDLDSLVKLLTNLGRRHAMYGCTEGAFVFYARPNVQLHRRCVRFLRNTDHNGIASEEAPETPISTRDGLVPILVVLMDSRPERL